MSLLDKASLIVTPNAYKTSKLYSVVPNTTLGDMTVVRATTATRVNASSLIESVGLNIPRIDYTNGSCPSLLVEPQITNVLTYSNDFSNAAWTKNTGAILANNATSPEGITNASKLVGVALTTQQWIYRLNTAVVSGSQYTFSMFAKKGEYNFIQLRNISNIDANTVFNLNTGTVYINSAGTAKIENYGNGWYRCSVTATATATGNSNIYVNLSTNGTGQQSFLGNGTSGVFIYGAQHELGSYPTSYIPTVASTVTRNADVISKTGISSLIGQTEGVLFVESATLFNDLTPRLLSLSNGTTTNRIFINYSATSNTIGLTVVSAGITILNINYLVSNTTQFAKIAVRYSNTLGYSLWVNGVNRGSNALVTIPASMSRLGFDNGAGGTFFFSKTKQVQLYKTALSDTEMATLTTL